MQRYTLVAIKKRIVKVLPGQLRKRLPKSIAIISVGRIESRRLNRIYRKKNKPANVLSFRYGPDYPVRSRRIQGLRHKPYLRFKQEKKPFLKKGKNFKEIFSRKASNGDYGEVIVCPEVIRREAKKAGNSYRYQLTWMILHGMLHLGGIHHEKSPRERKKFEKLEQKLLKDLMANH